MLLVHLIAFFVIINRDSRLVQIDSIKHLLIEFEILKYLNMYAMPFFNYSNHPTYIERLMIIQIIDRFVLNFLIFRYRELYILLFRKINL